MTLIQDWNSSQSTGGTQTIAGPATADGSFLHMTVARRSQDFTASGVSDAAGNTWLEAPATATRASATVHHFYCFRAASITAAAVQWSGTGATTHAFLREFDNDIGAMLAVGSISMELPNQTDLPPATVTIGASDVLVIGSLVNEVTNRTYTLQNTADFAALSEHQNGSLETCSAYGVHDSGTWGPQWSITAGSPGLAGLLTSAFVTDKSLATLAWFAF